MQHVEKQLYMCPTSRLEQESNDGSGPVPGFRGLPACVPKDHLVWPTAYTHRTAGLHTSDCRLLHHDDHRVPDGEWHLGSSASNSVPTYSISPVRTQRSPHCSSLYGTLWSSVFFSEPVRPTAFAHRSADYCIMTATVVPDGKYTWNGKVFQVNLY